MIRFKIQLSWSHINISPCRVALLEVWRLWLPHQGHNYQFRYPGSPFVLPMTRITQRQSHIQSRSEFSIRFQNLFSIMHNHASLFGLWPTTDLIAQPRHICHLCGKICKQEPLKSTGLCHLPNVDNLADKWLLQFLSRGSLPYDGKYPTISM
jgi:hypothetical protein